MRDTDVVDVVSTDERDIIDLAARGLEPFLALGRYKYLQAHAPRDVQRHSHLLVLARPLKGGFTFVVDDDVLRVQPGEAIRIPPGVAYQVGDASEPRGELAWIIMSSQAEPAADESDWVLRRAISVLSGTGPRLVWPAGGAARGQLDRLFDLALAPRDWVTDGLLHHAIAESVLSMVQSFRIDHDDPSEITHSSLSKVMAWIDQNIDGPCEVPQLVEISGLSASRFFEVFRAETGTSPKDYLLRRKIASARDLLRVNRDLSISDVAHSLGFSTSQYFATVFRRYYGCSPSEARQIDEADTGGPPAMSG
ncbi:MAG TPA: AraC family transcriptional regulator [Actinokineospora sp.]|jgi:AraC-like DNA-binding protein|nr:AraC family transcriptional regulator [Actinokineospora sp.]